MFPEIIAHRGAPREALENTLPAFRLALAQGADGIELDVHATSDGVIVVHHDPTLRTMDAQGAVALLEIARLDASAVAALPLAGGSVAPTLDEVLDLVGQHVTVYVEVKAFGVEDALEATLARHPGVRVAVHAFDHRIPVAARQRRPTLPIGLLSTSYPLDLRGFIGSARCQAFWQHAPLIDRALVEGAHELGAKVVAWTVNDVNQARALVDLGVDALCTDTPGLLRSALAP
jgi:glycerophosphoryl diester phosphodiesterase